MNKAETTELEYLRYFYDKVYPCLGPADDDIIRSIQQQFEGQTGLTVPDKYRYNEE